MGSNVQLLVSPEGRFVDGTPKATQEALRELLNVMSADDGGEMMSRNALSSLAHDALEAQGIVPITDNEVASLVVTGRAIMSYAFRPSPFET